MADPRRDSPSGLPKDSDRLGVVVLGYGLDAQAQFVRLLADLNEQGVAPEQVSLVWNPSASGPVRASTIEGVPVIRPEQNLGYAGGMNLGISAQLQRDSRRLLLLTMDVRMAPGAIARLRQAAEGAPAYGVLGPVTRHSPTLMFWGLTWSRTGVTSPVLVRPEDADHDGIVECDSIDGAAFLVRSEVFGKVGMFLDRFFMYYEETEFCLRAKRAGWRVGVVLSAAAENDPGEPRRPGAYQYLMSRNGLEFSRRLAGWPGVAGAAYRYTRESLHLLRIRLSPSSDRSLRELAAVRLAGIWLGMLAFCRQRWGAPPSGLPGVGDISLMP